MTFLKSAVPCEGKTQETLSVESRLRGCISDQYNLNLQPRQRPNVLTRPFRWWIIFHLSRICYVARLSLLFQWKMFCLDTSSSATSSHPHTLNTGGGNLQSLRIPLIRGKFHSSNFFSRVAASWNRFLSECSQDNYKNNLFMSEVNGYLFYECSKSTIPLSIKQPNLVNL